ncbi:hypothetical protein, variant 13 [Aphanomyces invadans]|uniref:Cyclic nucleotide-binding domain-containing protein n=1 Tax=Aphanomyces invadans TaxID=157072 RepID=A0A024UNU7_9STRA|nr:hypothetical protein, variant 10 [Aphanomyces invadans]XP_008864214.1 hypothetical protein, variant 11 [Aphanomyces invadans]XP_008864215.1 hypothetical protein, variant 12 [Aphanomyces invadans]XP_008864216.1 hypothetical protein, variant 13 [Aphanomyces invadans]ETW08123.1 hypothetical protein, variant 10 [Aphanomyces invadans]ETW08124.1 hypothetical protein, variant 11 [Aphanomyces invadans]ETW08125.1 hypothetical protein, variant 12 [Aphanomyces invadans]ETW08126.1 hypothetical protei|eukprot:XP_008864213.1 hypothetical protein, variant 10 [Aphanomyces invadans]
MKDNCKNTMIFGSSHDYIGREICRQMRLIKLPSRAMLIRQGDTGDRCYILIDGLVDVYCKDDSHILTCDETTTDLQYNVVKVTTDYGEYKATLGPGAVVGDVVLLNPSARRNATVIVSKRTTECCLVYLGRVDYVRLIRTVSMETSHYVQAEVLDYMYLFQKWPTADRMKLVAQMRSTTFRANDYLYRAGTIATTMFVLVSGEAMERQNFNLLESSRPLASKHNAAEVKINIELMLLGPGEIANEHAFLKANQVGAFDIKAVTDVHALCISVHAVAYDERADGVRHVAAHVRVHDSVRQGFCPRYVFETGRAGGRSRRLPAGTTRVRVAVPRRPRGHVCWAAIY